MDLQKSIVDFVIVTFPGVFLYFLGWVYLYYFLYYFGINVTELKLDTSTVFIYSYSPIYDTIAKHPVLSTVSFLIVMSAIFTKIFDGIVQGSLIRAWNWTSPIHLGWVRYRSPSSLSPLWRIAYISLALFLFILIVINFVLIPIAQSSAKGAADEKWKGDTRSILINLKAEGNSNASEIIGDFSACQERGVMVQIISDEDTLFLLCRSPADPHTGSVFEVKKKEGLISSRYVVD